MLDHFQEFDPEVLHEYAAGVSPPGRRRADPRGVSERARWLVDVPRFSVTVPAYNAEATAGRDRRVRCRRRPFPTGRCVVVDDGSTDETRAVAERIRVNRLARPRRLPGEPRLWRRLQHGRPRRARRPPGDALGRRPAAARSSCRRSTPVSAATPTPRSSRPAAGTSTKTAGARRRSRRSRWSDPAGCTLEELLFACFYGVGAVYRRAVFDAVGGFREDMYAEDYLFWLLALARGFKHRHIDRPLSVHRRTSVQKSANALLHARDRPAGDRRSHGDRVCSPPEQLAAAQTLGRTAAAEHLVQEDAREDHRADALETACGTGARPRGRVSEARAR